MNNNIKENKSKSIFDSVLIKRIFLRNNKKDEISKKNENEFIQSLIFK